MIIRTGRVYDDIDEYYDEIRERFERDLDHADFLYNEQIEKEMLNETE